MTRARWRIVGITASILGVLLFAALGIWQLERRSWKLDLIASVQTHVNAAPVPAPGPDTWQRLTPYQKVTVSGHWLQGKDTLVLAVTQRGRGYWVLSPLRTDSGFTVLVNRGFIPETERSKQGHTALPDGMVTLTGLLRPSEPPRAFLRHNDPLSGRWYSRHVEGIAKARSIRSVAPYFIDAGRQGPAGQLPVGGMTVIQFRNDHLQYALTWFALALGLAGGMLYLAFRPHRADE